MIRPVCDPQVTPFSVLNSHIIQAIKCLLEPAIKRHARSIILGTIMEHFPARIRVGLASLGAAIRRKSVPNQVLESVSHGPSSFISSQSSRYMALCWTEKRTRETESCQLRADDVCGGYGVWGLEGS